MVTVALGRSHPVVYAPALRYGAALAHGAVAAATYAAWRRTAPTTWLAELLGERFVPPPGSGGRATELGAVAAAFAAFAGVAVFAPFPLATLPSLLGKRSARAAGAWSLLSCAAYLCLRDRARGAADDVAPLEAGLRRSAAAHLALAAARPFLDGVGLYPAAAAVAPALVASLAVYAVAIVALSPPPSWQAQAA